jgi:hypothetical protein
VALPVHQAFNTQHTRKEKGDEVRQVHDDLGSGKAVLRVRVTVHDVSPAVSSNQNGPVKPQQKTLRVL